MKLLIRSLRSLEILDSRGNPTLAVEAELSDGTRAEAKVPSGASTGAHEAIELRDRDAVRYAGKGVRQAVANVNEIIGPALHGMDAEDQVALDRRMIELDGTRNKAHLGANATLGASCAVARAASIARGIALWQHLEGRRRAVLPLPMVNILSGGLHAGHNIEFQDFLAVPHGFDNYPQALEAVVAVHGAARSLIAERGYVLTGVADEGGWGPLMPANETALEILTRAIERAGYRPATQVSIAVDVASTHFHRCGSYHLRTEGRTLSSQEMIQLLSAWASRYPIVSVEDGLAEDDWDGWTTLTGILGMQLQLLGDDLFCTNPERLEEGIRRGAANAILVKMNQIGTLTETLSVLDRAREAGYRAVVSARSGETEDDFLADLAVASGSGQIKVGSVRCSERLSKYNRLLHIAHETDLPFRCDAILR